MARVETSQVRELTDLTVEAADMLGRLSRLLPEPTSAGPDTGTIGRHAPESREPWASEPAGAYWDLHFGIAGLVGMLRYDRGMDRLKPVAGAAGLEVIVNLAPGASERALKIAVRDLGRWVDRARQIPEIDETEPWASLPRSKGGHPPECPYCHTYALRMLKRRGEVRCFFPGCTDSDGNPTRARMEPGRMTGEARLVFGDGTTMGGEA